MKSKNRIELPVLRQCPCCKKDVLVHNVSAVSGIEQLLIEEGKRLNNQKNNMEPTKYKCFLRDSFKTHWYDSLNIKNKIYNLGKNLQNVPEELYIKQMQSTLLYHLYDFEMTTFKEGMRNIIAGFNPKKHTIDSTSFTWQGHITEVETLYKNLIKAGFIDKNTEKANFILVFSGGSLQDIEAIKWIKAKNLLAYLIDEISVRRKIPIETPLWNIAENCFIDKNGKKQNTLKQLKYNYSGNSEPEGKPRRHSEIDFILTSLAN